MVASLLVVEAASPMFVGLVGGENGGAGFVALAAVLAMGIAEFIGRDVSSPGAAWRCAVSHALPRATFSLSLQSVSENYFGGSCGGARWLASLLLGCRLREYAPSLRLAIPPPALAIPSRPIFQTHS